MARDARGLKALYYELQFDGTRFEALSAVPCSDFADPLAAPYLAVETGPGRLSAGQVLPNHPLRAGHSGSLELARIRLRQLEPADPRRAVRQSNTAGEYPRLLSLPLQAAVALRHATSAPTSDDSAARLSLDNGAARLSWSYYNAGDADQNSEVNIADLTPLGANLNALGPFDEASALSAADCDHNAEINLADLSVIGANFGNRVDSYSVFSSTSLSDIPPSNDYQGSLLPAASVLFADRLPTTPAERLRFEFELGTLPAGTYFWVRPLSGLEAGTPSNIVDSSGAELKRPNAQLDAHPSAGPVPLDVFLDASGSADSDGSIVQYQWDFDNDGQIDEDSGSTSTVNHVYAAEGQHKVRVVVTDDSGLHDEATRTIRARANQNPLADLQASPLEGTAPLTVNFDASGSSDPDGDIITDYRWDFDGDGFYEIPQGQQINPQYTYDTPGSYFCQLVVEDGLGGSGSQTVIIQVH